MTQEQIPEYMAEVNRRLDALEEKLTLILSILKQQSPATTTVHYR